jgi:hypothetical protein
MNTAYVTLSVALIVLVGAALVVAAFLDRRRGREIEHDPSRVPGELHEHKEK